MVSYALNNKRLLWLVFAAYLVTQAVVPAGFMPSSGAASAPYTYCHGDVDSAQILAMNDMLMGGDSAHDDRESNRVNHKHAHCIFSQFAYSVCDNVFTAPKALAPIDVAVSTYSFLQYRAFVREKIPARAPPQFPNIV